MILLTLCYALERSKADSAVVCVERGRCGCVVCCFPPHALGGHCLVSALGFVSYRISSPQELNFNTLPFYDLTTASFDHHFSQTLIVYIRTTTTRMETSLRSSNQNRVSRINTTTRRFDHSLNRLATIRCHNVDFHLHRFQNSNFLSCFYFIPLLHKYFPYVCC